MKKLLWSVLVICTSACCVNEETVKSVNYDVNRLNRIDGLIQSGIDSGYVNGMSALIMKDGEVIYEKAFGFKDEQDSNPLKTDDIFRIASQTKAITSVAAMILFEEGRFLLDDPIENYLPEFKDMTIKTEFDSRDSSYVSKPATKKITVRHLLTHTSGLDYFGFGNGEMRSIYAKNNLPSVFGSTAITLKEFSAIAGSLPLKHEPGEAFTYGINTDILGRLIEVTSGQSLWDFIQSRILDPIGMNDTYFYLPVEKQERLVPVFAIENDELVELSGLDEYGVDMDYPKSNGSFYSGGAGLSSTLGDYAKFLQMLLNDGEYNGKRILSPTSVRMMTANQIGDLDVGKDKFGLGFRIKTFEGSQEVGETEGSFSWGGYYGTIYWADPEKNVIGLMFANQRKGMPGNLHDKFKAMTYAAISE